VSAETQRLFCRVGSAPDVLASPDEALCAENNEPSTLLQKYQDAYDFAPVGFVSLDQQGHVVQTNLAGAIMLDIQRSQRTLSPLVDFVVPPDRPLFLAFHQEVLSGKCRRHCEVTLCVTAHRAAMVVRIDATLDEMGDVCSLVMIDVTEEKKIAAQELAIQRQQQELLARQPFMLWFKDPQGRLISVNASLVQDWRHFAQYAALEKIDSQSMPMPFFHTPGSGFSSGATKSP
jgi:PAS domain-containing protein